MSFLLLYNETSYAMDRGYYCYLNYGYATYSPVTKYPDKIEMFRYYESVYFISYFVNVHVIAKSCESVTICALSFINVLI